MSMRPKTKRRLVVLVSVVVLLAAVVTALVVMQNRRNEAKIQGYRATGLSKYEAGDYEGALQPLSKYITARQDDPEVRYAFAVSRSKVAEPSGNYLFEAIQHLEFYVQKRPDDVKAKRLLLELYNSVQRNTEAIALADAILGKAPEDPDAMRYKAMSLYRLRKFDEALAVAEKLNAVAPLDLAGQRLTYELMFNLRKPVDEVLKRAAKQREANAGDPRFELLQAYAHMYANQADEAEKWLDTAAGHVGGEVETVQLLSSLYDQLQKFDKGQKVLEKAADATDDIRLTRALVRRLWQGMRFADVIERTKALDPANGKADAELLAYRAFALYELQKADDARPIVGALEKRTDDDDARGWALALRARFEDPREDVRKKIEKYNAAISRSPRNPVIRFLLGEAYQRMQENELALDSWRKAIDLDPAWGLPWSQRARLLATTGRVDAAMQEAEQAIRRSPTAGSVIAYVLATYFKAVQTGEAADYQRSLKVAEMLQAQVPGESETLPIYVTLLAQAGRRDEAIAAINKALGDKNAPSLELLINLATASRRHQLGLADAIFERAEKAHGATPGLAYAKAMDMQAAGKSAEGTAYLKALVGKAVGEESLQWRLALASYLELIEDPSAKTTWVAIGEEFPDNLQVQSAVLNAKSPRDDRAFQRRTIDRFKALTGDEGYVWKIAQARWLLANDDNANDRGRDTAAAIVLLTDMLRSSPTLVEPRLLLARAMEATGNPSAAMDQLTASLKLRPESAEIAIELARMNQSQSKFNDARTYLDTAAASPSLTAALRQRIALMYAQQADYAKAIAVIEAIGDGQRDTRTELLLARLYRQAGSADKAAAIYDRLLGGSPDLNTIRAAADFYASVNKMGAANAALGRMEKLDLPAGRRELALAEFAERHESADAAVAKYRAAVAAAPGSAETHLGLIGFLVRHDRFEEAAKAADEAAVRLPDDADIRLARERVATLAKGGGENLQEVIDELSKDSKNEAAVATLKVVNDAKLNNEPADQTLVKLRQVADRYPQFLPVHKEVVRRCLAAGRMDDATGYGQRVMDALPTSAEAARVATEAYAAARKPAQMLRAAQAWRGRSLDNPRMADIAIAEADLALGQPVEALNQLKPYVGDIKSNPGANFGLVNVYARALVVTGKGSEAADLMLPAAKTDGRWRLAWLNLIAVSPRGADTDAGRIRQIEPLMDKASRNEQLALGRAWYDLAQRYGYRPGFEAARAIFAARAGASDADSAEYLLLGSTCEGLGDMPAAESAYRKALEADPNNALVLNQLAFALLTMNKSAEEARDLALRATKASPEVSTLWDTLARTHERLGDQPAAIKAFREAVRLQPSNIEALIGLASSLAKTDGKEEARRILQTVDNLMQGAPPLSIPLAKQLNEVRAAVGG